MATSPGTAWRIPSESGGDFSGIGRWMQSLVNAQVEINRAVFLMNVQMNKKEYQGFLTPEEYSDAAIKNV